MAGAVGDAIFASSFRGDARVLPALKKLIDLTP